MQVQTFGTEKIIQTPAASWHLFEPVTEFSVLPSFPVQAEGYFMTDDAELAAQGRLLNEHADTQRRLALLEAEIAREGEHYAQASGMLLNTLTEVALLGDQAHQLGSISPPPLLSRERAIALVDDYRATRKKLATLRRQLRAFHLDL
jgi:hypothetical protein